MAARVVRSALGSLIFLVAAPGTVAVLVPWVISGWRLAPEWPVLLRALGAVLVVAGTLVLLAAFLSFVREGRGTPAPVAETDRLVVGGWYRYVRNPMYLAVGSVILGQAVGLPSVGVAVWFAGFAVMVVTFVVAYEEPRLHRRFGEEYLAYRRAVPGWWPRSTPWTGSSPDA